jgi:queuine tRNA-ribosyltransferase
MTGDRRSLVEGCACPACSSHTRDYLSYLSRAEELTAVRLLVMHNLHYTGSVMEFARRAISDRRFGAYAEAIIGGASPWEA